VIAADISVVIPTLGREMLRGCLDALAAGHARPARVIVVDQGRIPAIERMVREMRHAGIDAVYLPSSR
jgi:hypothetical protein